LEAGVGVHDATGLGCAGFDALQLMGSLEIVVVAVEDQIGAVVGEVH
jgi:hypothetical protein